MTLSFMIYGVVLGAFLAGAAFFLDRGLRALGRPTRWVWALVMAATAGSPLWARLLGSGAATPPRGISIPPELLYDMLAVPSAGDGPPATLWSSLDGPLALGWALCSVLILGVVFWTALRLRRAARTCEVRTVESHEVLVSAGLGPAVLGLFRPRIVLPAWTLELDRDRLRMVLLHEEEHRAARDPGLLALGILLAAASPWNPSLWWMARRLHLAVEGDCDRRVLARGVPPKEYGSLLLDVASGARSLSALAPALVEGGSSFLERRLLMIGSTVRKHRIGAAVLATLTGAGLLALACETPTPPASGEDTAAEATFSSELSAPAGTLTPTGEEFARVTLTPTGEGYFLVKKTGGNVEYLQSVSPDQLKLISEEKGTLVPVEEKGLEPRESSPAGVLRIRGEGGPDAPKPLFIVDGVLMSETFDIAGLNKNDIESIEVIKGPAAEAKYGEAGAGGVVQITMKH